MLTVSVGALVPLAAVWSLGLTVLHRDSTGQYAPLRPLIGEALRAGRLPLWNPHGALGMPLLGETTHGVLHPVSILVAFLFPGDGLDPLVGAWLLAAAIGAYAFARTLGASRRAAVLAAFAYGLSGWTLSMTSNLVGLAGAGSAPWVVAGLRVAGRDRSAAGFALGAAAVAAGALGGDMQALAVASVVGLGLALEAGGRRAAPVCMAALAAGALLAGVQLAPSWSLLQLTDRVLPLAAEDKLQWDLAPWRLLELVSPGLFTVPADGMGPAPVFMALGHPTVHELPLAESVFVGGGVLLLAAAGVAGSRRGAALAGAFAVVTWFAMGRHLGARAVQDLLPVASGWRYGEKFLTVGMLCLAGLAALGADRLVEPCGRARWWSLVAGGLAAVPLAAWAFVRLGGAALEPPELAAHLAAGLPHAALGLAAVAAWLWLAGRGKGSVALAGLVTTGWLAGVATAPLALRPGSREARLETRGPQLVADPPGPRVLRVGEGATVTPHHGWDAIDRRNFEVAATYTPNFNARQQVDAFGADTGLTPIRWRLLLDEMRPNLLVAARRYAVTHVVLPTGALVEGGRPEVEDPRTGMVFWAIPHRAWASFPGEVISVDGVDQSRQAVAALLRQGRRAAVVEAPGPLPAAPGRVLEVRRGRERIDIVAEADAPATLVVNDAWWPGWRASIDGLEVTIVPADVLVRAVPFPAGRHTLEMRYEPPEIRSGLWLSLAGLAAIIGGSIWLHRHRALRGGP